MPAIEAVVFDIGNVLIRWDPEAYYDRTIGPERRRAMFADVDLHQMNEEVDLGGNFKETIYATADQYPAWRAEIRDWHDNWIELAQPVIDHSLRLLRALRGNGVPVFSLTNFGVESHAHAVTHYPFLTEFDRQFISGHLQITKPDPRIYQAVESQSAVPPERLLFADDRPANIDAARARGWQTHLFEAPDGWARRLVAEELLTEEEAV
ncbi:MAG: HAD family phosphatase [Alphaproteobacteria bacterium]|nr:HAD family phosphatase [Alphaproteobacteria bacterium]